MTFKLTSPAFQPGGAIARQYTCQGADISPAFSWSGAPAATKSFAFIMDDPDAPDPKAPKMTYVHWVLYNIPADANGLPGDEKKNGLPKGTLQGTNDWKRTGYGGPCPPIGRHRYFHKLYALDAMLPDLQQPTKPQLLEAMKGHVLAETQLMGTYQKEGA